MKRLMKLLSVMLAVVMCFFAVACNSGSKTETLSVSFSDDLPETVQVGTELKLRNYIEEDPEAVYILYVSYTNPNDGEKIENKKQSSMTFTFDFATVYDFTVEMIKGKASATATVSIEALPDAPAFLSVNRVRVEKGATKTFTEIVAGANILITPSDLVDDIKFKSVEFNKATFDNSEETVPELTSSREIATTETAFTFTDEGTYVFDISATNKSGTAVNQLTVTNVDSEKQNAKAECEYDPEARVLSWQPVEGATAYRLEVDGTVKTLTETNYSFMGYEDGAYSFNIYPVYSTTVYADAKSSATIDVGYVRTPLVLSNKNYTVQWEKRLLCSKYKVTENGGTPVELDSNVLSYTLTGSYTTHDQVKVEVVALFDDGTETQNTSVTIDYGTVTFDAWDLADESTKSNMDVKPYSGIQTICVGENLTDTFFMVEFTGKNVPNFAVRAVQAYPSATEEEIRANKVWSDAGIFINTSTMYVNEANAQKVYVNRGISASGLTIDGLKGILEADTGKGFGGSIIMMKDNVKYVMIMGYQVISGTKNATVTCYLMTVEGETVTKVYQKSCEAKNCASALSGTKAILYPALTTQKTSPITFTYYPAKATLESVINDSTSLYKAGIKTALGLN